MNHFRNIKIETVRFLSFGAVAIMLICANYNSGAQIQLNLEQVKQLTISNNKNILVANEHVINVNELMTIMSWTLDQYPESVNNKQFLI
jgi:hypothetical protein